MECKSARVLVKHRSTKISSLGSTIGSENGSDVPAPYFLPQLTDFFEEYGLLLRKIEKAAAGDGVGSAEGRALRLLLTDSKSPSAIADGLGRNSPQTSRLIASLTAKGLVERISETSVRKQVLLTPEGREQASAVRDRLRSVAASVWKDLDSTERERLTVAVDLLRLELMKIDYPIKIRDAKPGDTGTLICDAVHTLLSSEYGYDRSVESIFIKAFARLLARKNIIVVAERFSVPIGGIAIAIEPEVGPRAAKIEYFVVFSGEECLGTGTKLLDAGIERAKSARCNCLHVEFPVGVSTVAFNRSYFAQKGGWEREWEETKLWAGKEVQFEAWSLRL